MEKERRRSGERARSGVAGADFFPVAWGGISFTEAVDEALEWIGVEETEECKEPAPRIRLGSRRPGILADVEIRGDVRGTVIKKRCGAERVVKQSRCSKT